VREHIQSVVEELTRLRREGVHSIYLADDTLGSLERAVSSISDDSARAGEIREDPPNRSSQEPTGGEKSLTGSNRKKTPQVDLTSQSATPIPNPPVVELPEGTSREQWAWLRDRVLSCPVCNAHLKPGKKVVFGVGNIDADIFFCGEAPGAEEEVQGEPFVGPAGQLLTKIIEAMGLNRSDVYIGNIMNWRPEMPTAYGNRPPTGEEFLYCLPYLRAQLSVVKPKVIVALGATAVSGLLGPDKDRRMGAVRGQWFSFEGVPLLITYHPSYVLRNGSLRTKRLVWEDMLQVMERSGLSISEKQRDFFKSTG